MKYKVGPKAKKLGKNVKRALKGDSENPLMLTGKGKSFMGNLKKVVG